MSKIGKLPITIPEGVEVTITNNLVKVKWPKGELEYQGLDCVKIKQEESTVVVTIDNDDNKKFRGLTRTLIANMVEWVTKWYEKKLHIIWVGYWAKIQGNKIDLALWLSHKVIFELPELVSAKVEQDPKWNTILTFTSIDKQLIGEVAAKIRDLRKPEPYKGKGIRYFGEEIKLKAGKAAKK